MPIFNFFTLYDDYDTNITSGQQISAEDLTWSYAEVLNAMRQRKIYMASRR